MIEMSAIKTSQKGPTFSEELFLIKQKVSAVFGVYLGVAMTAALSLEHLHSSFNFLLNEQ